MFNKKGLSLLEAVGVLLLIAILSGTTYLTVSTVIEDWRDTTDMQNLSTLADATSLFMAETNGVAPCFSPEVGEGTAAAGVCANSGYDYVQGKPTDNVDGDAETDVNIDSDVIDGEAFTVANILVPTYLDRVPAPARDGQRYVYVKGNPSTINGSKAFAYNTVLAGSKAKDILNDNISVINTLGITNLNNLDTPAGCTASQVSFNGNGTALVLGNKASAAVPLENDTTRSYTYYAYDDLVDTTGAATDVYVKAECDVYSEGALLQNGNFTETLGNNTSEGVAVTIN